MIQEDNNKAQEDQKDLTLQNIYNILLSKGRTHLLNVARKLELSASNNLNDIIKNHLLELKKDISLISLKKKMKILKFFEHIKCQLDLEEEAGIYKPKDSLGISEENIQSIKEILYSKEHNRILKAYNNKKYKDNKYTHSLLKNNEISKYKDLKQNMRFLIDHNIQIPTLDNKDKDKDKVKVFNEIVELLRKISDLTISSHFVNNEKKIEQLKALIKAIDDYNKKIGAIRSAITDADDIFAFINDAQRNIVLPKTNLMYHTKAQLDDVTLDISNIDLIDNIESKTKIFNSSEKSEKLGVFNFKLAKKWPNLLIYQNLNPAIFTQKELMIQICEQDIKFPENWTLDMKLTFAKFYIAQLSCIDTVFSNVKLYNTFWKNILGFQDIQKYSRTELTRFLFCAEQKSDINDLTSEQKSQIFYYTLDVYIQKIENNKFSPLQIGEILEMIVNASDRKIKIDDKLKDVDSLKSITDDKKFIEYITKLLQSIPQTESVLQETQAQISKLTPKSVYGPSLPTNDPSLPTTDQIAQTQINPISYNKGIGGRLNL